MLYYFAPHLQIKGPIAVGPCAPKSCLMNVPPHNVIKKKVAALKILLQNLKQKWNVFYKNWKEQNEEIYKNMSKRISCSYCTPCSCCLWGMGEGLGDLGAINRKGHWWDNQRSRKWWVTKTEQELKYSKFVINNIKQDEEVKDRALCFCWERIMILFLFLLH